MSESGRLSPRSRPPTEPESDLGLVDAAPGSEGLELVTTGSGYRTGYEEEGEPAALDLVDALPAPEAEDEGPPGDPPELALLDRSPDSGSSGELPAAPVRRPDEPPRARRRAAPGRPPGPRSSQRVYEFYPAGAAEPPASRPARDARGPGTAGFAQCRVCEAKNPIQARVCGRCGDVLPPLVPPEAAAAAPGPGVGAGVRPGRPATRRLPRRAELDPAVLPPEVRDELEAGARARAQRDGARRQRWAQRRLQGVALAAAGVALLGLPVSFFALSAAGGLVAFAVDLALGAAAGLLLTRGEGGAVSAQVTFGGAATLGNGAKLLVGLVAFDPGLVFLFLAAVWSVLSATVGGALLAIALEQADGDEGF